MEGPTFDRKSDEPPTGMTPIGLDDIHRFVGCERMIEDRRISEQPVEFGENQLRDGDILETGDGTEL